MFYFTNRDINRLALHVAVLTLASALSGVFFAAFLIRAGLSPAATFLSFAAILVLRFALRPLVLIAAPAMGLRRALVLGTFLLALSCPVLALVDGIGPGLAAFVIVSSLGQVFYCTCYHAFVSALGDTDYRGSQISAAQALGALAGVFGPVLGGLLLTTLGPWPTFGLAFVVTLASILPLLNVAEPQIARTGPRSAYAAARNGVRLYFADGWIQVSLTTAWSIVMFQALGGRFDSLGGTLSLAGLAGALGGMVLGRVIDNGHARSVVWINAAILAIGLVLRSATFGHAAAVVAVAIVATLFSGLYMPSWMTAIYNEAKTAPCALRFQFAAEGGWDAGGALAGIIAATFCVVGMPIEAAILLALPMVPVQALLLARCYETQYGAGKRGAIMAKPWQTGMTGYPLKMKT